MFRGELMPKRTVVLVAWAFLFLAPFVPAKSKKTPPVDPRLLSAQFVRVVSATGSDINPRTYPEDREAVFAVQNALKKWGRFHVTYEGAAGEPDLIIVVRKGRYGSAVVSPNGPAEPGPVGRMPGQAGPFPVPTGGIRVGTEAGNAPDERGCLQPCNDGDSRHWIVCLES